MPLALDYYVLPGDLDKAKTQFAQAAGMIEAYQHYFGEYPFAKDGYKLIEVPYSGMEHQSAVSYGNHFENGYLGRDWTGVGISKRFDFIIIHESGHEWFGNSVTRQLIRRICGSTKGGQRISKASTSNIAGAKMTPFKLPQRHEAKDQESAAYRGRARRECRTYRRPVLQGRAHAQHPAQRR